MLFFAAVRARDTAFSYSLMSSSTRASSVCHDCFAPSTALWVSNCTLMSARAARSLAAARVCERGSQPFLQHPRNRSAEC
jgi:hypothetical protein